VSLRDYHEALNEWAKVQKWERRNTIENLRTRARITRLNAGIDAIRQRDEQEALRAMCAQWPSVRSAIEACTGIAGEVRATWLKRFDDIRGSASRTSAARLDDLAADVNAFARRLEQTANEVRQAADARKPIWLAEAWPPSALARLEPSPDAEWSTVPQWRVPMVLQSRVPGLRRLEVLAPDLAAIRERILAAEVSVEVSAQWLTRLEHIDRCAGPRAGSPTAADRAWMLASAIEGLHDSVRSVASSLSDQASKCRSYWNA
jgi:hypothetical protein